MAVRTSSATDEILASSKIDPTDYTIKGHVLKNANAVIANAGYISFGTTPPTSYGDKEGVYIGYNNGPKVSLFSNYQNYFQWDGSKLLIQATNFTLDANGRITATDVDLSGKITATEGLIGGWNLTDTYLYSGSGSTFVALDSGNGDYTFYAGSETPANAKFAVKRDGTLIATGATISGNISITDGLIGGWVLSATALTSDLLVLNGVIPAILMGSATDYLTGTGLFIGNNNSIYKLSLGNPTAEYLAWDGTHLRTNGSWIGSTGVNPTLQAWKTNIVFSSYGSDTINWTAGTIELSDGITTYAVNSGTTGSMTALTYIYLDVSVSLTDLQITTTYSAAVGDGKILIASAQNNVTGASVVPFSGQHPIIDGSQLIASSIMAGQIAASSITADKLNVTSLSAITALMGDLNVNGLLSLDEINSAISIGAVPPISSTHGTGIWIDRTGMYGLNGDNQEFSISSGNGTAVFGGGSGAINSEGIVMNGLNYLFKHTATYNGETRSGRMRMFLPEGSNIPSWGFDYVGLALGPNLLSNGSFNTDASGWTGLVIDGNGQVGNCGRIDHTDDYTNHYAGVGILPTNGYIRAIAKDPTTGYIYVGGYFTSINGVTAKNIAYWDGSKWNAMGSGVANYVFSIGIDSSSGFVYVGGNFSSHFTKWDKEASTWTDVPVTGTVYGIHVDCNDHIWVCGTMTLWDGVSVNHVVADRKDGRGFVEPDIVTSPINNCYCLTSDDDGNVYVGGNNLVYKWSYAENMWKVLADYTGNSYPMGLAYDNITDTLYLCGSVSSIGLGGNNVNVYYTAKYQGGAWSKTNDSQGIFSGYNSSLAIRSLAFCSSNRQLYVTGDMLKTSTSGSECDCFATLDTTYKEFYGSDPWWQPHIAGGLTPSSSGGYCVFVDDATGMMWVGGSFTGAFGNSTNVSGLAVIRCADYQINGESEKVAIPSSYDSITIDYYLKAKIRATAHVWINFYDSNNNYISQKVMTGTYSAYEYNQVWTSFSTIVYPSDIPSNATKLSIYFGGLRQPYYGEIWIDEAIVKFYGSTTSRLSFQPQLTLSGDPVPTPFFIQDQITPSAAPTGFHGIYPKSDGWYSIDSGGVETPVGSSSNQMYNNSGSTVVRGDVLVFDPTIDSAFTTTTALLDTRVLGVSAGTINNGETGLVESFAGKVVPVNCDTTAVSAGQFLCSSHTVKKATTNGYFRALGCFAIALTSKADGVNGTVQAMLIDNFRQGMVGKIGYFFGGQRTSNIDTGQRFMMATGLWANLTTANLSAARRGMASLTYGTVQANILSGYEAAAINKIDVMPFATETTSISSAVSAFARYQLKGNGTCLSHGYQTGGYSGTSNTVNVCKLIYSSMAVSTVGNLSSGRAFQTNLSDGTYDYVRGGTGVACDKIPFSTDTAAVNTIGNLPAAQDNLCALSFPASAGYNPYNDGSTVLSYKLAYSSGTQSVLASTPPNICSSGGSVSDGITGGWVCGSNVSPYTQANRFDASTETYSADSNATLTAGTGMPGYSSYGSLN